MTLLVSEAAEHSKRQCSGQRVTRRVADNERAGDGMTGGNRTGRGTGAADAAECGDCSARAAATPCATGDATCSGAGGVSAADPSTPACSARTAELEFALANACSTPDCTARAAARAAARLADSLFFTASSWSADRFAR